MLCARNMPVNARPAAGGARVIGWSIVLAILKQPLAQVEQARAEATAA